MTTAEKQEIERSRRETALKNTLFNRYLLLRYSLALFFFSNLYWLLISFIQPSIYLFVPAVLLVGCALASAEQFRLYGKQDGSLVITRGVFLAQAFVLPVLILIALFTPVFSRLFPIFADNQTGRIFVASMLVLGQLLTLINLKRITLISHNADKAYTRYLQMEQAVHNRS